MKKELIYKGKAKEIYSTESADEVIIHYTDEATAFNNKKKEVLYNKGVINNEISGLLFDLLSKNGIKTHFLNKLNKRESLCLKLKMIPLEVIVRNVVAGSLIARLGLNEGYILKTPIIELCYKNDQLGDPLINSFHVHALDIASQPEIDFMYQEALKINSILKEFFYKKDIQLIDFKLEFGKYKNEILLGDEISPDSCRLWDKNNIKLDKDRFRYDLGMVVESYSSILAKINE